MHERFTCQRRVEFCETDAAGIAHFSSFLCYMEQAEHQFLRHIGTSVVQSLDNGWHLSWPRVHVDCDFLAAVKFEELLTISVGVLKMGSKSVSYAFDFFKDNELVARGKISTVCCRVKVGEPMDSVAIPEDLRSRFLPYVIDSAG
jgi:4-hydroxybenzoyl-CoA thioesterase/acyl-CoA thioester hydrolase